jgi:hypothetical protein
VIHLVVREADPEIIAREIVVDLGADLILTVVANAERSIIVDIIVPETARAVILAAQVILQYLLASQIFLGLEALRRLARIVEREELGLLATKIRIVLADWHVKVEFVFAQNHHHLRSSTFKLQEIV